MHLVTIVTLKIILPFTHPETKVFLVYTMGKNPPLTFNKFSFIRRERLFSSCEFSFPFSLFCHYALQISFTFS